VLFLFCVYMRVYTRMYVKDVILLQKFDINQSDPILYNIADLWDN
jgi:hypothetical protein